MGNSDIPQIFDSAAKCIPKNIADANSMEIAFICRETFKGIKELLRVDLGDIPYKSVLAAEAALNKIDHEYSKLLENKDGLEVQIGTEIKAIEDEFDGAISHITSASKILNKENPQYNSYVRKGRQFVDAINTKIAGFDDLGIDSG